MVDFIGANNKSLWLKPKTTLQVCFLNILESRLQEELILFISFLQRMKEKGFYLGRVLFSSETIRQYQNHMSDVFCVNNLVTHPVPTRPVHGPAIHEAAHLLNKTCPTDKTGESPWVKRGQNLLHIWKQQSKLPQRDPQIRRAPGQSHRMPRSVSSLTTQSCGIFKKKSFTKAGRSHCCRRLTARGTKQAISSQGASAALSALTSLTRSPQTSTLDDELIQRKQPPTLVRTRPDTRLDQLLRRTRASWASGTNTCSRLAAALILPD